MKQVDWQDILERVVGITGREVKGYLLEQQHLGRVFLLENPQVDDVVRSWGYEEFGQGKATIVQISDEHIWLRDQFERVIIVSHLYLRQRLQTREWKEIA